MADSSLFDRDNIGGAVGRSSGQSGKGRTGPWGGKVNRLIDGPNAVFRQPASHHSTRVSEPDLSHFGVDVDM